MSTSYTYEIINSKPIKTTIILKEDNKNNTHVKNNRGLLRTTRDVRTAFSVGLRITNSLQRIKSDAYRDPILNALELSSLSLTISSKLAKKLINSKGKPIFKNNINLENKTQSSIQKFSSKEQIKTEKKKTSNGRNTKTKMFIGVDVAIALLNTATIFYQRQSRLNRINRQSEYRANFQGIQRTRR